MAIIDMTERRKKTVADGSPADDKEGCLREYWPAQVDGNWQEQMVLQYAPLIKYIASRLALRLPSHISLDDLISSGIVGLIDAIHKFNPGKNIKFKTYAEFRIKGAILDEQRSLDWMSRSVRKKSHLIENAYAELQKNLGRPAEPEEVAAALGLELEEFYQLLDETKDVSLVELEEMRRPNFMDNEPSGNLSSQSNDNPFLTVQLSELRDAFTRSLPILPYESQLLLSLYYGEELTMREIAHIMKCTQSRISQLHAEALLQLQPLLAKELSIENFSPDTNLSFLSPDRRRGTGTRRNKSFKESLPKTLSWLVPVERGSDNSKSKTKRRKAMEEFYIPDFVLIGLPYKSHYPKDLIGWPKQSPLLQLPFDWEYAISQFGKMRLQRIGKLVKNQWIKELANSASISIEALTILLNGRQVDVLYYYYIKNMTQEEVGEKIGISASQVSRALTKAKENLQ